EIWQSLEQKPNDPRHGDRESHARFHSHAEAVEFCVGAVAPDRDRTAKRGACPAKGDDKTGPGGGDADDIIHADQLEDRQQQRGGMQPQEHTTIGGAKFGLAAALLISFQAHEFRRPIGIDERARAERGAKQQRQRTYTPSKNHQRMPGRLSPSCLARLPVQPYFASSLSAMVRAWTSSGPSARRSVRMPA